jgi:hypothetical protein
VTAGQGKGTVIVAGRYPGRRTVTRLAGLRETQTDMIGRSHVVGRMAGVTIRRNRPKRSTSMTLGAIEAAMAAG